MGFFTSAKTFIIIVSIGSLVVLAGIISDMNFNSDDFMNQKNAKFVKRFDDFQVREIASTPYKYNCTDIKKYSKEINGTFKLVKLTDSYSDGQVEKALYKFSIVCDQESENLLVQIGDDDQQVFYISYWNKWTIRLTEKIGGGSESLEARKTFTKKRKNRRKNAFSQEKKTNDQTEKRSEENEQIKTNVKGLTLNGNDFEELKLISATQGKAEYISGDSIFAENLQIRTDNGSVEIGGMEISVVQDGKTKTLLLDSSVILGSVGEFSMQTDDGRIAGRFSDGEAPGIYSLRFNNGPLDGFVLAFGTETGINKVIEAEGDDPDEYQDEKDDENFEEEKEEDFEEKREEEEIEDEEENNDNKPSEEEMDEAAERSGHDF